MKYSLISHKMAFIYDVPIEAKIDDFMIDFVLKEPTFTGVVTVFKDTKFLEDNGEIHQRQYEYEVEQGKFRKKRFTNPLKWKTANKLS